MVGDFSAWLGRPLPPTFFWDYPTVERVARHVGEESAPDSQATPDARRACATGSERAAPEPIAIVGMACRFPGAENVEAFWRLLRDGVDAITEVPPGRWETRRPHGFASRGGFLKQVDGFDAHFFGISPREAAQIDPQQRLLLEVAWEALEDAGYAPDRLGGTRTGVFVGISNSDYAQLQFNADASPDAYAGTGSALSIAANRLSYLLDLHGPSMAVDTACSSSLVAVHAACQSLRAGESRAALAGGVNLLLTPKLTEALARAGMMSADGRCKTFDAAADGYVRAEGCGVVVLKRLSDAFSGRRPRGGAHPRLGHQSGRAEQRADGPERAGPTGARSRGAGRRRASPRQTSVTSRRTARARRSATPSSSPPSAPSCARGGRAVRRVTSAPSRLTSATLKRLPGSPASSKSHSALSANTSRRICTSATSTRASRPPTRRWRSLRAGATGSAVAGCATPA